jgi:DNA-binding NarL/FixJ family response regulator
VTLTVIVVGELTLPAEIAPVRSVEPGQAVPATRAAQPDVVLVDLDAGAPAAAAVGALAAELPGVPVVAVASAPDQVLDVVRAGATGYVLRDDPALPQIVRAAAAGGTAFGDGLAAHVLDATAFGADVGVPHLTERESEVLRLVVEGLTARQIATRLVLSPRTVENHIQHVLRKVDVPGRAALVRYAILHGLA